MTVVLSFQICWSHSRLTSVIPDLLRNSTKFKIDFEVGDPESSSGWLLFFHSRFASVIPDLFRNPQVKTALKAGDPESSSGVTVIFSFQICWSYSGLASVIPDLFPESTKVKTALKAGDSESSSEWQLFYHSRLAEVTPDLLRNPTKLTIAFKVGRLWISFRVTCWFCHSGFGWMLLPDFVLSFRIWSRESTRSYQLVSEVGPLITVSRGPV